ncbi:Long-chain-fatty-acid--CoA ligase 5 [Schistosoma japonicum]|nr:Long-chain-fatty-acid--CoA ligase 5 [Schistosoma japonicum]
MNWVDVHLFTLHPVLLALFLIIITFIVTAQRWGKIIIKPVQFTDCQSVVIDEKTGLRASVRKLTVTDIEKLKSPFDVFKRGLEKSKDKFCFGTRQSFTSPIQWTTYEEWVMTQFANAAYSLVTIPLYSTFSDEAIVHVCNETELKIIACDTVSQACHLFKITSQEIEVFIIMKPDNTFESIKKELSDKVHMFTFEEILEKGRCHRLPVKVSHWSYQKIAFI